MLFQNPFTSHCALYSVENLIEYLGIRPADKKAAFSRFGMKPGDVRPISHQEILRKMGTSWTEPGLRWEKLSRFDFGSFVRAVPPFPTLATFWIQHREETVHGDHCVVVTGADESGVELVDPLGRRDRGRGPNARVLPDKEPGRGWRIEGTPYYVRPRRCLVLTR